jgi:hypothetical protein
MEYNEEKVKTGLLQLKSYLESVTVENEGHCRRPYCQSGRGNECVTTKFGHFVTKYCQCSEGDITTTDCISKSNNGCFNAEHAIISQGHYLTFPTEQEFVEPNVSL